MTTEGTLVISRNTYSITCILFFIPKMSIFYLKEKVLKKQIHKGVKLKERLNQKYSLIKSEDPPFFSTCYKISLLRLDLLFRIAYKVHISLFKQHKKVKYEYCI